MQNGYFQLKNQDDIYGVMIYQPREGGEYVRPDEIKNYLSGMNMNWDPQRLDAILLDEKDGFLRLGTGQCPKVPESYNLRVSEDGMSAYVRFIPASEGGSRMTYDGFLRDMRFRNITSGIRTEGLQEHFQSPGIYCTDILVAQGREAVQGTDARIEYYFNTDPHKRPLQREDGSVDYFQMTTINQCKKGEELARIIPENPGEPGVDIFGHAINPREVKRQTLKFGRNIELSEDKCVIRSMVDGHVTLVDDKVFVSEVFAVKDVDVSTGNLNFEGSIEINGRVSENFEVRAGGNVVVNGVVEGARIIAGGNIIISKGMNGMGKGYLRAGGDIIVKFLENSRVIAGGYVQTEAIMHSQVSAGSEVRVEGRRGTIVGGSVHAAERVTAKTIGANLGAATILEVGVNPLVKEQYNRLQKGIAETTKTVKDAEVILDNFKEKLKKGVTPNEGQVKYMKTVAQLLEEKKAEIEQMNQKAEKIRSMMETQKHADIVVNDEIFPGTTIIIGDASKTIQTSYHYCKFVREKGEVCMAVL